MLSLTKEVLHLWVESRQFPGRRPKGRALRAGCFYSILMTDQGEVFTCVADHVTVCPDMKGGALVHTHLVNSRSEFLGFFARNWSLSRRVKI